VGASGNYARYDGSTWTRSSLTLAANRNLTAIWASSSTDVYVIGGPLLFHSSDGSNWQQVAALPATDTATAVYGNGPSDVYVIGHDTLQTPVLSHWDGSSWTPLSVDAAANHILFRSVYVHGSDVWAVGLGGAAHYAGGVWQVFTDSVAGLISVHGTDSSNVWAVGISAADLSPRILRWDPVNRSWIVNSSAPPSLVLPIDVWTSGPNDVWRCTMTFSVEGDYFETCNCDVSCNCIFTGPATQDHCDAFIGWHVRRGSKGGVDVSGLNAAMAVRSPKRMLDGGWRVALYVDERASAEQYEALVAIFSGQAGGHLAALAPLIGKVEGITKVPVTFDIAGGKRSLKIGDVFEGEIEELVGGDGRTAPVISNPPFGALPQPVRQSKSVRARYREHWNSEMSGTNAFTAEFAYSG